MRRTHPTAVFATLLAVLFLGVMIVGSGDTSAQEAAFSPAGSAQGREFPQRASRSNNLPRSLPAEDTSAVVPAPPAPPEIIHTVAKGEHLGTIELRYGVGWKRIFDANPKPNGVDWVNPNLLHAGWQLRIPRPEEVIAPRALPSPPPPSLPKPRPQTGPKATSAGPSTPRSVASVGGPTRQIRSTAYSWGCGASGNTASGEKPHFGGVASRILPRGSVWLVHTGRFAGHKFRVNDTGPKATFDIFMPEGCKAAINYGDPTITIERVG